MGNAINITYFNKDLTIITITSKHARLQIVTHLKYKIFSFRNFVILVKCGDDDKTASWCDAIHVKPLWRICMLIWIGLINNNRAVWARKGRRNSKEGFERGNESKGPKRPTWIRKDGFGNMLARMKRNMKENCWGRGEGVLERHIEQRSVFVRRLIYKWQFQKEKENIIIQNFQTNHLRATQVIGVF